MKIKNTRTVLGSRVGIRLSEVSLGHPLGVVQVRMVPSIGEFEQEVIIGQLASVNNDHGILDEMETPLIALMLKGIER